MPAPNRSLLPPEYANLNWEYLWGAVKRVDPSARIVAVRGGDRPAFHAQTRIRFGGYLPAERRVTSKRLRGTGKSAREAVERLWRKAVVRRPEGLYLLCQEVPFYLYLKSGRVRCHLLSEDDLEDFAHDREWEIPSGPKILPAASPPTEPPSCWWRRYGGWRGPLLFVRDLALLVAALAWLSWEEFQNEARRP